MIAFAFAALLAASPTMPAPASAPQAVPNARPAIWVVKDADTTVYLFGTFHALDGKTNWLSDEVRTAFDRSDELILETIIPDASVSIARQRVTALAAEPIRPGASFLASTRLALSAGKAKGLSYDQGADAVLRNAARFAGKKVIGLETFEFQLDMFAKLQTEAAQPATAGQAVDALDNLATVMATMQASWKRGEGEIFAGMLDDMKRRSPATYRVLFLERNAHWAEWVAGRMQAPGTVFVAVGAGHLAGSDSLQNKLAMLGIRSTRLN